MSHRSLSLFAPNETKILYGEKSEVVEELKKELEEEIE
jgi:hypothetical protein